MLDSLDRVKPPPVAYEVIIVDNGSTDDTSRLVASWIAASTGRHSIYVEQPGKARALNAGITASRGSILAFLDDDLVVDSDYLVELVNYARSHDYAAAQGNILLPPQATDDAELAKLLKLYQGVIPHVKSKGSATRNMLTGANIMVRRETFEKIGRFNEKLGPGASGFAEDGELSERILAGGGRIGVMGDVRVTHEVDRSRLTEAYFLKRNRELGRSRHISRRSRLLSIVPNLARALLLCGFFSAAGNDSKKYRYKGQYYQYREMLSLTLRGSNP